MQMVYADTDRAAPSGKANQALRARMLRGRIGGVVGGGEGRRNPLSQWF